MQNVSFPLDFFKENERINWKYELTFFKGDEISTILACMKLFHSDQAFGHIFDQVINDGSFIDSLYAVLF